MKKTLAVLLFLACGSAARPEGIPWTHDLDAALTQAGKENKWVFVDFYSDRCPACKNLDTLVYPRRRVVETISRFVPVKINAPHETELASRYNVSAYPTLMVLDAEGRILEFLEGALPPDDFAELFEPISKGLNPLTELEKKARKAPNDPAILVEVASGFLRRQHHAEALTHLEKGFPLAEPKSELREQTGRLMFVAASMRQDLHKVEEVLKAYSKEFPESRYVPLMYLDVGRVSYKSKEYQKAISHFEAAKEATSDFRLRLQAKRMIDLSKDRLEESAAGNHDAEEIRSAT